MLKMITKELHQDYICKSIEICRPQTKPNTPVSYKMFLREFKKLVCEDGFNYVDYMERINNIILKNQI